MATRICLPGMWLLWVSSCRLFSRCYLIPSSTPVISPPAIPGPSPCRAAGNRTRATLFIVRRRRGRAAPSLATNHGILAGTRHEPNKGGTAVVPSWHGQL